MTQTRLLLALIFLLSAVKVQSETGCHSRHCDGFVERIFLNDQVLRVVMVDDMDPLKCNLEEDKYLTIEVERPAFREMHGMLLGAMLSARPVFVRLPEDDTECKIAYVSLGK